MKWIQASHLSDKIKGKVTHVFKIEEYIGFIGKRHAQDNYHFFSHTGVFNLINNGKAITKDIFEKLLKRMYPDDSDVSKINTCPRKKQNFLCNNTKK